MKIKINTSITLSTGEAVTGAVVQLFNENFALNESKFVFDIKAWRSEADMNANKDNSYLFNSDRITNGFYAIPQDDMEQAAIDGHFGVIGTNHPIRIKETFATMLNITANDVQILALV
jgi:hypothetical protein